VNAEKRDIRVVRTSSLRISDLLANSLILKRKWFKCRNVFLIMAQMYTISYQ
jgi:hypothetical protein